MTTPISQLGDDLLLIQKKVVINLPGNIDYEDIEEIENAVLDLLSSNKKINGVVVGMGGLQATDYDDLNRLAGALSAFRLLGARIGLCGINPGLAAIIIRTGIELPHDATGHDLDHVLEQMR